MVIAANHDSKYEKAGGVAASDPMINLRDGACDDSLFSMTLLFTGHCLMLDFRICGAFGESASL